MELVAEVVLLKTEGPVSGGMNILGTINSSGGGNGLGNILDVVLWGVARMAFLMGVFGRL